MYFYGGFHVKKKFCETFQANSNICFPSLVVPVSVLPDIEHGNTPDLLNQNAKNKLEIKQL